MNEGSNIDFLENNQLPEILERLYNAAFVMAIPHFLELVKDIFNTESCFLMNSERLVLNASFTENEVVIAEYNEQIRRENFFQYQLKQPFDLPIIQHGVLLKKSMTHHWDDPQYDGGQYHFLGIKILVDGDTRYCFLNRRPQFPFNEQDQTLFRLIQPHLMKAFHVRRAIRPSQLHTKSMQLMVENNHKGLAVFDNQLKCLAINDTFKQALDDDLSVVFEQDSFQFLERNLEKEFQKAVHDVVSVGMPKIFHFDNQGWFFRISPFNPQYVFTNLVKVELRKAIRTLDTAWAKDLYQLTRKEMSLLNDLLLGLSLKEISEKENVSYNTSRKHLRSLLSKTETQGQVELIAKIQKFY